MKIDETTGLYGNYGVWHVPFWHTMIFKIIVISLILIIVIGSLVYYYRRNRSLVVLSPEEVALQEIERITHNLKSDESSVKDLYSSLISTLKNYIHSHYGYDILSKTDKEVIAYLHEIKADESLINDIQQCMNNSETARFALTSELKNELRTDCDLIIALINKTKEINQS